MKHFCIKHNLKKIVPSGKYFNCSECVKEYAKKSYSKNLVENRERNKTKKSRTVDSAQQFVFNFLCENPCVMCGEKDPIVLDFDHLGDKHKSVCYLIKEGYSLETIKKEIEKCQVLCANCHRRKTAKERKYDRADRVYKSFVEIDKNNKNKRIERIDKITGEIKEYSNMTEAFKEDGFNIRRHFCFYIWFTKKPWRLFLERQR